MIRRVISTILLALLLGVSLFSPLAMSPHQVWAQTQITDPVTTTVDGAGGDEVTNKQLDNLNPLKQNSTAADQLDTPGEIVSRFLEFYAFPIAGLILFVMLLWGGFEMMMGAADKKSIDAGKQRVTAALVGFFILFLSYWIAKIIGIMFGIQIV